MMSNPISMFYDEPNADGVREWSMTRVVAFMMAVSYCWVMNKNATNAHLMGYPFMWLGIIILMAVPFKMLFTYIQEWFSSSPGQKLLLTLMAKFSGATLDNTSTTVETKIATHADKDKG